MMRTSVSRATKMATSVVRREKDRRQNRDWKETSEDEEIETTPIFSRTFSKSEQYRDGFLKDQTEPDQNYK